MKKSIKYLSVLVLLIVIVFSSFSLIALAEIDPTQITGQIAQGNANTGTGASKMLDLAATALLAIQWAGIVFGVILFVWFGIQWMTGGAAKKAELKTQLWNYVIGLILLFGAGTIADVVYKIAKSATQNG
jgi:hypothetical protein